jgi:hypothetical protein
VREKDDYMFLYESYYLFSYIIVLIFIFIFETSSDCEESNVYHLKKYPFHPGVVHRPCGSMYMSMRRCDARL